MSTSPSPGNSPPTNDLAAFIAQITNPQFLIAVVFGMIALLVLARRRFDQPSWVTKELEPVGTTEASHLTTLDRSLPGLVIYFLLLLLLYVLLCGLGPKVALLLKIPESAAWAWPIVAATAVVGIGGRDDKNLLGRVEQVVRKWSHEYALVPHRLQDLAKRLDGAYDSIEVKLRSQQEAPEPLDPKRRSNATSLELRHTDLLMRALNLADRKGLIAPEFTSERQDAIDRIQDDLQRRVERVMRPNGSGEEHKAAIELNRRARFLLASGLLYGRRNLGDIDRVATAIGVRWAPGEDIEAFPSLIVSYVSCSVLVALSVILVQALAIWPYFQGQIERCANCTDADKYSAIQSLGQASGISGFTFAITGIVLYCSVAFWMTRLRDASLDAGEPLNAPLNTLGIIVKASLLSTSLTAIVAFVLTPVISISQIISIISIVLQCLIACLFVISHFTWAPRLRDASSWLHATGHILCHGVIAALLVAGTTYLGLRIGSISSLSGYVPLVIQANDALADVMSGRVANTQTGDKGTANQSTGAPVGDTAKAALSSITVAERAVPYRGGDVMQAALGNVANVANHGISVPAKSEVFLVRQELEKACQSMKSDIVEKYPGLLDVKPEIDHSRPISACQFPSDTIKMIVSRNSDNQSKADQPSMQYIFDIDSILLLFQLRNHEPFVETKWAWLMLAMITGFLFASFFSVISLIGRAWQLRENRNWTDIKRAYSEQVDMRIWMSTPLSECLGLEGWTPLEAAVFETPRKLLLDHLNRTGAGQKRTAGDTNTEQPPPS
jgi:hypothetical protein